MLDTAGRFTLPGLDGVVVFPDDRLPGGFYLVSDRPAVALGTDGRPELSLTVYGRRSAGVFAASGGLLVLTTTLAVPAAQLDRVRRALTARLVEGWPPGSPDPAPEPQLLAADWREGAVTVRLTADAVLTGVPSLTGDNRCSFSSKLSADAASALQRAWADGLPDATISYSGRLRSREVDLSAVHRSASRSVSTWSGSTGSSSSSSSWSTTSDCDDGPTAPVDPDADRVDCSAPLAGSALDLAPLADVITL